MKMKGKNCEIPVFNYKEVRIILKSLYRLDLNLNR